MSIDYDTFDEWARDRFGKDNIKYRKGGKEICTHSFFVDGDPNFPDGDRKFKLWMNPSGGNKELENGAFRCWYTDSKGSLITLVSIGDRIPYDQAAEAICGVIPLRALEMKVHDFFNFKEPEVTTTTMELEGELTLPPYSFRLTEMSENSSIAIQACLYLDKRKLPYDGFFVCTNGDYKNRLVIPYYDKEGKLIYYNCRTLDDNPKVLRYMKAPPEVDQKNVLYAKRWPKTGSKIYLTEGEFDAMSLSISGLYGVACGGKYLSASQIEMLREYQIVLAFDSDEAGKGALTSVGEGLLKSGFSDMSYIRPPEVYKDWNKLLEERDVDTLRTYIQSFEKPYNSWTANSLIAQRL